MGATRSLGWVVFDWILSIAGYASDYTLCTARTAD